MISTFVVSAKTNDVLDGLLMFFSDTFCTKESVFNIALNYLINVRHVL